MEEVNDAGFEDYSVSTTLEKIAFSVEQAIDRWLKALAAGRELPDQTQIDTSEVVALHGVHHGVHGLARVSLTTMAVPHFEHDEEWLNTCSDQTRSSVSQGAVSTGTTFAARNQTR
jgi:hypothetical protein